MTLDAWSVCQFPRSMQSWELSWFSMGSRLGQGLLTTSNCRMPPKFEGFNDCLTGISRDSWQENAFRSYLLLDCLEKEMNDLHQAPQLRVGSEGFIEGSLVGRKWSNRRVSAGLSTHKEALPLPRAESSCSLSLLEIAAADAAAGVLPRRGPSSTLRPKTSD